MDQHSEPPVQPVETDQPLDHTKSIDSEPTPIEHVIQDHIVDEIKSIEHTPEEQENTKILDSSQYSVLEQPNTQEVLQSEQQNEPLSESHDFILNDTDIKEQVDETSFLSHSIKDECIEPNINPNLDLNTPVKNTNSRAAPRKKTRVSASKSTPSSSNQTASSSIMNTINDIASGAASISPPSAQKRRKKDPSAPKAPLNGYLVYFNEERSEMRQKNPNIGFGELTKIIAAKWKELPTDEKQKYINEAELDKERYVKEMADYKKSDAYKQYLKENTNSKSSKTISLNEEPTPNQVINQGDQPNVSWLQNESSIAGFDIPIFTEEFIEHSKQREQELRHLRKEINELEQQNGVLNKHVDNLKQTSQKLDMEMDAVKNSNNQMQKSIDFFRQTVLHCFSQTPLPNTSDYVPTNQNIDDYIMRLFQLVSLNNQFEQAQNLQDPNYLMNRNFVTQVKSVFSKMNIHSIFENC
ncbi:unnamed protein product [Brachionus calyciflorus]|uniref:HMG box domain-containing protein n=1 Tax=Brachionus calyciflorus TaxID=104777 RepID=A0A813XM16_9BILA|nr:unnamed protein product [Brachionus calyciflorus]